VPVREDLLQAARVAVGCVALGPHESCLVLSDPARENIALALYEAAREVAAASYLLFGPERARDGEEPPAFVAALMRQVDVVLAPTSQSLTHTAARRAACAAGARVATLPGIRETTLLRCFGAEADPAATAERTERVTERLAAARRLRIWTAVGTELELQVEAGSVRGSTGRIDQPGTFDNLPSGEVGLRPAPGTARGRVVVDGSMAAIGDLTGTAPIVLDVEEGRVVRVTGGDTAEALERLLADVGPPACHFAELGIGTNDAARVVGSILEDEKVFGTVYVGLGSDLAAGGGVDVPLHLDGVVLQPNIDVDGRPLMRAGALVSPG
jgi:leucyl aminopeptidase (aminopeptidase T)